MGENEVKIVLEDAMIRAVLKDGNICLLEPLPLHWKEGEELSIEPLTSEPNGTDVSQATDAWMDEVERSAQEIEPGDEIILENAIAEIRRQSKELARHGKR